MKKIVSKNHVWINIVAGVLSLAMFVCDVFSCCHVYGINMYKIVISLFQFFLRYFQLLVPLSHDTS